MNNKGISLLEVILTLSILTIIGSVSVPSYKSIREYQKQLECNEIAVKLKNEIMNYITRSYSNNAGDYPILAFQKDYYKDSTTVCNITIDRLTMHLNKCILSSGIPVERVAKFYKVYELNIPDVISEGETYQAILHFIDRKDNEFYFYFDFYEEPDEGYDSAFFRSFTYIHPNKKSITLQLS